MIRISDEIQSFAKSSDTALGLYRFIKNLRSQSDSIPSSILEDSLREISFDVIPSTIKETTLLPLKMVGYKYQNIVKSGGAIEHYNKKIIVSDKFGSFFKLSLEDGVPSKLSYPKVPTNHDEYVTFGDYGSHPHFGIKDLLLHEDEKDLWLYISHHSYSKQNNRVAFSISRISLNKKSLESNGIWKTIFTTKFLPKSEIFGGLGSGGRIIEEEGKIILTVGDYNHDSMLITSDERAIAQNETNEYGSVISIDPENGNHEILSIGNRNPQGLVKTNSGRIFSTEHGPRGGDELNIIIPGSNFGWPYVSTGMDYEHYSLGNEDIQGRHDGFAKPIFSWLPSIGISNLVEVSNFNARWDGDLLVASLKAMTLFRLRLESNRILYSEPIFIGSRIRDLINADKKIILWTDDSEIKIISIEKNILLSNRFGGISSYKSSLKKCLSCHHLEAKSNPTNSAPTLKGIIGRKFGSDLGFEYYSDGIKQMRSSVWNAENMSEYLKNPQSVIPGTSMGMSPVTDSEEIKVLIEELTKIY